MNGERRSRTDVVIEATGRAISRRQALAVGLSVSGAVLGAACAPSAPATPPSPTTAPAKADSTGATAVPKPTERARRLAGSIQVGAPSIAVSLDPHANVSSVSSIQGLRQIYDALVGFDTKGEKIIPQLASEWKRIDGLTTEFKLRDDVKFSNGESFTAETVEFNVDRLMSSTDPAHQGTKSAVGTLGAEVVNSTTVRIKTKEPDPILLNRLTSFLMAPHKYTADGADLNTRPLGTGSFKVAEYVIRQRIKLEAWDGSWRGKSTVQTATIHEITEPTTLLSALRRGEVDIIFQPPADQVAGLQRDGFNVSTVSAASCTLFSLMPSHPWMRDRRVRQAINLAVNKEELLKTIQAGLGRVAQGQLIEPGMLGYRDDIRAIHYDPERAKALVKESGIGDTELQFMTASTLKMFADAIAGYLNAVGIKARSEIVELALLVRASSQSTDRPALGWNANYFLTRDFDSAARNFTKEAPNPHFDNAEFTNLFRAARSELDEKKRADMIGRMGQIMHDEAAALFLLWRDYPTAYTKKIATLDLPYDTSYYLWKIEKEV